VRKPQSDWAQLTRSSITWMVVVTAAAGFFLALGERETPWLLLAWTLAGTGILASGASALNQVVEAGADAQMERTQARPLPAGRVHPDRAFALGVALVVAGLAILVLRVNLLTAALGAATIVSYLFLYTPLKKVTSLATVVGAVPGALPPMMGWSAVRDDVGAGAWALFGILFCWQLPHFLAIAWMYREDYARGGFPTLPIGDPSGRRTGQQMVIWSAALIPVSILPSVLDLAGVLYLVGALVLGLAYLAVAFQFSAQRSEASARRLLLTSVAYLPALLIALLVDRLLL
jgi:heme o synthase